MKTSNLKGVFLLHIIGLLLLISAFSASAAAPCDEYRTKGKEKVIAAHAPLIDELTKIIANMKAKGLDPTKYYDAKNDKVINLVQFVADLIAARDSQLHEVDEQVDKDCEKGIKNLQDIMDAVVARYTKGLSLILPKHISHIDVGEILSGKPLGGPNSVFNEIRDKTFDRLGMGENNDLRKAVTNPVSTTKDTVNDALKGIGFPGRL